MSEKKRMFNIKRVMMGVIAIIIFVFVISFVYVNDYYKADSTARDIRSIESSKDNIEVLVDGDYTRFVPSVNKKDVGLIFYPGGKVESKSYVNLMMEIAKQGYTAVLVDMPYNLSILGIDKASYILGEEDNVSNWYVGGHSLGGVAAVEFAKSQDEVKGVILLGAYSSSDISKSNLEVLSIYGSKDGVINMESFERDKSLLPKNSQYVSIDGGNHSYFGNYGEQKGDGIASISREEQQMLTALEIADFFDSNIS